LALLAHESAGIEIAGERIADHTVDDAVVRVACRDGRRIDDRERRCIEWGPGVAECLLAVPHIFDAVVNLREIGGAPDIDAVVIGRVALRFHQAFLAASRATDPIRVARQSTVELARDRLGPNSHLVRRSPTKIHEALGWPNANFAASNPPCATCPVLLDTVA
jgi:hypothetical protein